ncbi:MAG: ABC transporter permease [Desulfobacterales bacterium]|nr:MAG: ABC transporter permease [Desulfobacterales bacterium]
MKKQFIILAFRNLAKYRTRNLLTGISIAIGTAGIIVGLALTDGIIRQTIIGFTGTIVEDVMVFPPKTTLPDSGKLVVNQIGEELEKEKMVFLDLLFRNKDPVLRQYRKIERAIYEIDGIDYVTRKVQFQGAIFSETSSLNCMIMGMEPEGIRRKTNLKMEKGRYLTEDDRSAIMISQKLARRLQVDVGDKLALVVNMPNGGTNAGDLRIEGIFSIITGLQFVNHLMYISLWDAQALMGIPGTQVFNLGVYLKDVDAVDRFESKISTQLEKMRLPCQVLSWKKVMMGILAQYYFIKYIVLIFTIVLLLIVCVGVINAVFLSVSERTREIGTMMAMGAKKKSIITLFMLEGTLLSVLSSLSGAAAGVAISLFFEKIGFEAPTEGAANLFGGTHLYPYLSYPPVVFSLVFVVVMTLLGIGYPIIKASRMEPTEALRYI